MIIPLFAGSLVAAAQNNEGLVMNWDDGSTMPCRFYFEEAPHIEWNNIDPPPVTVQTAAAILRNWTKENDLGDSPFIRSYRLIMVDPLHHEYGQWAWFVNYIANRVGPTADRDLAFTTVAITMFGQVVPPVCGDQ